MLTMQNEHVVTFVHGSFIPFFLLRINILKVFVATLYIWHTINLLKSYVKYNNGGGSYLKVTGINQICLCSFYKRRDWSQ